MPKQWNRWAKGRVYQVFDEEAIRMTQENTARVIEHCLTCTNAELKQIMNSTKEPSLLRIVAGTLLREHEFGQFRDTNRLLDRVIGKAMQKVEIFAPPAQVTRERIDFIRFAENAGYPLPFELQTEMMRFGIFTDGAKMLLGSRGYGKTDYVVILGLAYALYLDWVESLEDDRHPEDTTLLITKSDERNSSILTEIQKAAASNGVPFTNASGKRLRVQGLKGKDNSVSALTIGSSAFRGRHPKRIVMDDPVTEEDTSEATRRRVQRVYNEVSKLTGNILIIGQPVHKFDLYETLRPFLNKMEVPHGSIPQLDHDLEAQRLAGVSEESIQASYFLKVISEAGNPLENVRYIDSFPSGSAVAFVDPSFEGGDFTAMSVIKAHFDGVAVFGKCWKRAWFNCVDEIAEVCATTGVQRLCFETNSLGEQPVVLLRGLLDGVGVVGKKSLGNKHARIMAAGPFSKSIHLAKTSDRTYIDQIVKYEYGAKNDDAPDSLASALEWIGLIRGKA